MAPLVHRTLLIATAVPAEVAIRVARATHRAEVAQRLRHRVGSPSVLALVVTTPFWLLVVARGLLYPVTNTGDLEDSWGGPTLVGAWSVHLLVAVATLLVASLLLAAASRRAEPASPPPRRPATGRRTGR